VIYFSDVIEDKSKLISDFSFLPEYECSPLDEDFTSAMKFSTDVEPVSMRDHLAGKLMLRLDKFLLDNDDLNELYYDEVSQAAGHKIGGYPTFTQEDPRNDKPLNSMDKILLFQLDADDHIMFGDSGVCNFFIAPVDLKSLDFSRILYNWDCC